MARHIKRGDQVMVIAGADKGRSGRVLRLLPEKDRVVVEGINRVWKHVRPSQRNPQGGRIQKDASIHISNVLPLDPVTGKGTRVRFQNVDGAKRRIAVRGGTDLGVVRKAPSREAAAVLAAAEETKTADVADAGSGT